MCCYLGVDIGTTSVKAVAFSEKGDVLLAHARSYQMHHPDPNYSEQNPEEIFNAVINCMNEVLKELLPGVPALVSFSAMMHSLLAIDKEGKPLTNCIIWADNRAGSIADALKDTPEGKIFYEASGVPVHAMSPLCKLLWIKENHPDIFLNTYKFIGIKEYIFFRLFNEYVVDTGIASTTGLLNIRSLQWDKQILAHVGIDAGKLSKLVNVKTVFHYGKNGSLHRELILDSVIPVVIGSSDGALANIGAGAVNNHSMAITIGTSSAARIITHGPNTDQDMRTFCYHVKDNCFIVGGASSNGAIVMQWLKDSLLCTDESLPELFQLAETIRAGSDGLVFLPFILGERAPIWNSNAKGNFFGFTINHTKAHLIRAAIEGIVYCLYSIGKVIEEKDKVLQLYASGGFALSSLWLQIVADIFGKQVLVSDAKESSALGAVIVGIEAMGKEPFGERKNVAVYEPDNLRHEEYKRQFSRFERLYEQVKMEFTA